MQQKRHKISSYSIRISRAGVAIVGLLLPFLWARTAMASEAELVIPDLGTVAFLGVSGRTLLFGGIGVCVLGLSFGLVMYRQLKLCPSTARCCEISELIYETCKTYLSPRASSSSCSGSSSARSWSSTSAALRALRRSTKRRADHPALQPGRHRRQLRRRLVRHPHQHLRQLAHRLRRLARQAVPDLRDPAQGRACRSACC